jgi:hypothetical protein
VWSVVGGVVVGQVLRLADGCRVRLSRTPR